MTFKKKYTIFQTLVCHFEANLLKKSFDLHFFLQSLNFCFLHTRGGISSSASSSGSPFASPFASPFVSPFGQSTPSTGFAIRSGRDFGGFLGGLFGKAASDAVSAVFSNSGKESGDSCDRLDGTSLALGVFCTSGIYSVSCLASSSSLGDCNLGLLFLLNGHPVKDAFFLFLRMARSTSYDPLSWMY